jgi:hypothetical protein
MDRRSQARSGVRTRLYGGEADVACPGATSCTRLARPRNKFKVALFKMNLIQNSKLNHTNV